MVLQYYNFDGSYGVCCLWINTTRNDMKNKDKETEESIKAYREAAEADTSMFGDYDAYKSYDINKKKTSEEDESV